MQRATVTIRNPRGIHLRPATLIVKARKCFEGTEAWLISDNGDAVPLDSPLELLGMGLTAGTTLRLETAGPDETACADALAKLFQKTYDFH